MSLKWSSVACAVFFTPNFWTGFNTIFYMGKFWLSWDIFLNLGVAPIRPKHKIKIFSKSSATILIKPFPLGIQWKSLSPKTLISDLMITIHNNRRTLCYKVRNNSKSVLSKTFLWLYFYLLYHFLSSLIVCSAVAVPRWSSWI